MDSLSRVAMLPTTLQIDRLLAPRTLASRSAASVSAVSPDCVMATARVEGPARGRRYRYSDP